MVEKEPVITESGLLDAPGHVYNTFNPIDAYNETPDQKEAVKVRNTCSRTVNIVALVAVITLMVGTVIGLLCYVMIDVGASSSPGTNATGHATMQGAWTHRDWAPSRGVPSNPFQEVPEDELRRIDCYPESEYGMDVMTPARCADRGCLYRETTNPGVPWCFVPQGNYGFLVSQGPIDTPLGLRWLLRPKNTWGIYDQNFDNVTFDVEMREDNLLRFKFTTPDDPDRYEIPWLPSMSDVRAENPEYTVDVYQQDPFSFRITRTSTGSVIWDTGVGGLVVSNQFLQIATALPSANIYGFGENAHKSFKHDVNFKSWPIFATDDPPSADPDKYQALYSSHPFYECVEADGSTHGVLFWNSNAMDYTLTPYPMLVYKTIGGIMDFYIFMGPTPENVIQQYTGAIGRPSIPPYYSLGFQLSRYGYTNTSDMRDALQRTQTYGIPLDLQYADIDHMDRQRSFTLDHENFTDLPNYVSELHDQGMRTVLILNPFIEIADDYNTSVRGRDMDVFLGFESPEVMPPGDYEMYNSTNVMGTVWPEWIVNFIDGFKPQTQSFWKEELRQLYNMVPFDGIWLDMNEPANFDTNREKAWNWPDDRLPYYTLKCPVTEWDDPPYRTKAIYMHDDPAANRSERLSFKTVCMQSVHGTYRHYDVHNLYGHQHTALTHQSLLELRPSERPMIISRSSMPGDGRYSGRWLGDNGAIWPDMALSIIGMLEFNLFGMPYIGADICGFFGNATEQLCKRWHQLGAFYPYARNHNHEDPRNQDPGWFGDEVGLPTRDIMLERYRLLPYLYTLFYTAHTSGGTVVRPLFHEFPTDNTTYEIDSQFLWGAALLITPILEEDAEDLSYYLPSGRWYNYWNGVMKTSEGEAHVTDPVTPDSTTTLHIRGGYILPTQTPGQTTTASRLNVFGLKVALDGEDGQAAGELFWDDGISHDTVENGQYYLSTFRCNSNVLSMTVERNNDTSISSLLMDTASVYGVSLVSSVLVNSAPHGNFTFSQSDQILEIGGLGLSMVADFTVEWTA